MSYQLRVKNEAGFTLLELLIAMTIGLVVLGSIFSSFTTQKKSFELQEQITVMEQNLRVPLDIITRDLRNAGVNPNPDTTLVAGTSVGLIPDDPNDATDANVPITTNSIKILSDIDGNGAIPAGTTDPQEKVTYDLSGTTLNRNGQPLVDNIITLTFTYYDSNGNTIATPITGTNLSNIRVVQLSITAQTNREDSTYTTAEDVNGNVVLDAGEDLNVNGIIDGINITGTVADGGCRTRTLTAKVRTRNIGLQKTY